MTLDTHHPAVTAYLARLDTVMAPLPAGRRSELRAEIVSHLAEALPPSADDAQVRDVIDRLGTPEDIVAAERASEAGGERVGGPPTGTTHEAVAVVLLTVGSVVPIVGWLVGVVLVWTSRIWTMREKLVATLVFPGGPALAFLVAAPLALFSARACSSAGDGVSTCTAESDLPGRLAAVLFLLLLLLPFVVAIVLYRRAARRVAQPEGRTTTRSLGAGVLVAVLVALPLAIAAVVVAGLVGVRADMGQPAPAGVEVPVPSDEPPDTP